MRASALLSGRSWTRPRGFGLPCLLVIASCLWTSFSAEPPLRGKVSNFSVVPEYYNPPHQAQMKSLLQGAEAEPQADQRIFQLKQLKLQTFREDGTKELVVEAPECIYDSRERSASSPGLLRVQTGDGKFSMEGKGFLWRQTNSSLIISNDVHTRVQPELLENRKEKATTTPGEAKAPPTDSTVKPIKSGLDLWADRFTYEAESGLARYLGKVRAAGTNLSMSAGLLTIVLPVEQRRLDTIAAEQDVLIDSGEIHASGQKVQYSMATDLIELYGEPKWRAGQQEGSGDQITIEKTNRIFRANGHAVLRIAGLGDSSSAFVAGNPLAKTNVTNKATNGIVEVLCDNYELRTNSAFFQQNVRVTQRVDDQPKGKLTCAQLSVAFAGTNQLQSLIAEKNVVLEQDENRFTAGKVVYSGTNEMMELLENPTWKAGAREGNGDLIQVNVPKSEMRVDGNAFMRLPAEEVGLETLQGGKDRPLTPALSPSAGGRERTQPDKEREFADILCQRYTVNPQRAHFEGNVRLKHPQMQWSCETIDANFPATPGQSGRIVAERGVTFDLNDEKGAKVHGTGDKAVYTFGITDNRTNNFVELTGNPVLETTNGTIQNAVIILDVASRTLALPGKFRIVGSGPVATNLFTR